MRKFSRKRNQRKALMRNLLFNFFLKEKIKTTEAKAKELRSLAERFINRAKKNNLSSRRYLASFLPKKIVKKLVDNIAPQYRERNGGYTRILKLGPRKSNGAKMAIIELVK